MPPSSNVRAEYEPRAPLSSFVSVSWGVVAHPGYFFATMPYRNGYVSPGLFSVFCIMLSAVAAEAVAWNGVTSVGRLPIVLAIDVLFLAVFTGVLHLIVLMTLRSTNKGLEGTFRVAAYGQVIQLINWVPTVGLVLGILWGVVLTFIGLRAMHRRHRDG